MASGNPQENPVGMLALESEPLVTTYSIVARDADTGQMGIAVHSCHLAVGAIVPWAEAGVGVVATQAFANAAFGPDGLDRLRAGATPQATLTELLAGDSGRDLRQVAILDAAGRVAAHTGSRCVRAAGHLTAPGVSVQANMMTDETVWPAMLAAYEHHRGDLAARLLAALAAAEDAGGDIRGRQSAALVIVEGERQSKRWQGRVCDLRVDDHPDPVGELGRLVRLQRAERAHAQFIAAVQSGRMVDAIALLEEALRIAPELDVLRVSGAIGLYLQGRRDEARTEFHEIFTRKRGLADWLTRMAEAGLVPADPGLLQVVRHARGEAV
jgi:uncharacterized Ntn-hydrolase superfamily protein